MMNSGGSVIPSRSETESGLKYRYQWPDLEVSVSEMPKSRVPQHLLEFENYVRNSISKGASINDAQDIIDQIRKTRLVVGVVASPDFDSETRAESIVGAICDELHAMMFFNNTLYRWDGQILVPAGL